MRTLLLFVSAVLFTLAPLSASAQGLPIGWAWSTSGDELTVQVEAFDLIEDVHVEIRRHHDGRTFDFNVGDMSLGDVEGLDMPVPTRTSTYTITIAGTHAEIPSEVEDQFEIPVLEAMDFDVDTDSFDEEGRRFILTMTQPAGHVEITVRGDTGELLTERTVQFDGEAPGTPLEVTWTQGAGTILTIDVKAVAESGAWASRQYIPWKVEFDAAHVSFASGSAEIPEADMPMLRARLAEITQTASRVEDFVEVQLYVAGYTDTVGSSADNQRLSEERARSIGAFFREEGVRFDVFYQGFGESALAVPTEDNVDEPQNRRSVFILSTREPPTSANLPRSNWRALD